mgnify:FL=1
MTVRKNPIENYWETFMEEPEGTERDAHPEVIITIEISKEHKDKLLELGFEKDDFEILESGDLYLTLPVPENFYDIDDEMDESSLEVMGIERNWCLNFGFQS